MWLGVAAFGTREGWCAYPACKRPDIKPLVTSSGNKSVSRVLRGIMFTVELLVPSAGKDWSGWGFLLALN